MRVSGVFDFQVEFLKNNLRLEIGGGEMSLVYGTWIMVFWFFGIQDLTGKTSTFDLE